MKVYGPQFSVASPCQYPLKAQAFDSLIEAKSAYEYFLEECDRYGQTPADAFLYVGVPHGDEADFGYPDYPDYLMRPTANSTALTRRLA